MVEERRKTGLRERPYVELRTMAKVYAVMAPVGAAAILFAMGFSLYARVQTIHTMVLGGIIVLLLALVYYLIMKAASQSIYILFDIAGNASRVRELMEQGLPRGLESEDPSSTC
jgi:hypothetical protein